MDEMSRTMSNPVRSGRPDAASMTAIRGLLERNLLARAVALSETRWPGSGPVVELAHEWATLSPGARRERLAAIGPEELGRLRAVGQLQPDLARVLDDLEARGIIPPEQPEQPVDSGGGIPPVAESPASMEEAVADAIIDYSEQGLQHLADSVEEDLPPQLQAALASTGAATAAAVAAAEVAKARGVLSPMEPVPMPELDLGLPSTSEFLANEAQRRLEANSLANNILDRARSRVDESAERLMPPPVQQTIPLVTPVVVERRESTLVDERPAVPSVEIPDETPPSVDEQQSTRVDSSIRRDMAARIESSTVLHLESHEPVPSFDELQAVASTTNRKFVTLCPEEIGWRAFFGGLVRTGRRVEPEAGAFPIALGSRNLVVVVGRLYPRTVQRLREGFCDIPGTQATVKVHPDCRVVLLPE